MPNQRQVTEVNGQIRIAPRQDRPRHHKSGKSYLRRQLRRATESNQKRYEEIIVLLRNQEAPQIPPPPRPIPTPPRPIPQPPRQRRSDLYIPRR